MKVLKDNNLRDRILNQSKKQIRNLIWNHTKDQIWNQIRFRILQIWNQIGIRLHNQMENQIGFLIWRQTCKKTNENFEKQ